MQKKRRHTAKNSDLSKSGPLQPGRTTEGPPNTWHHHCMGWGCSIESGSPQKIPKHCGATLSLFTEVELFFFFNQYHQFDAIILYLAQIFSVYDKKWLQQTKEKKYNDSINSPFLHQSVLATSKHLAAVNWWFSLKKKSNFFLLLSDTNSVLLFSLPRNCCLSI